MAHKSMPANVVDFFSEPSIVPPFPKGGIRKGGFRPRCPFSIGAFPFHGKIDLGFEPMICRVIRLGIVDYGEAYQLQMRLCQQRLAGEIPDVLLLLEHPPTITIGKSGKTTNILVGRDDLDRQGVSLFFTDRGGDVTYHGPGQLVAYPIIDLRQRDRDVHAYVHDLEEVVLGTLARFDILGNRNSHPGVWVGEKQIAAIGIAIKRWITMHGIALNVRPQQDRFSLINPCGLAGVPVTSIRELKGEHVAAEDVAEAFVTEFASTFQAVIEKEAAEMVP